MRIYYEKYQEDDFSHTKKSQWIRYGYNSFKSLLRFLDFRGEIDLEFLQRFLDYDVAGKGGMLLKEGEPCDRAFFVINGVVKITTFKSGQYEVIGFATNGSLVSSTTDFLQSCLSSQTLIACTKTRYLVLRRADLEKLSAEVGQDQLWRLFNEFNMRTMTYLKWLAENARKSPIERIVGLYEVSPEVFSYVTDTDIAVFLGMARGTFSRLKSEVFRKM